MPPLEITIYYFEAFGRASETKLRSDFALVKFERTDPEAGRSTSEINHTNLAQWQVQNNTNK